MGFVVLNESGEDDAAVAVALTTPQALISLEQTVIIDVPLVL